MKIPQLLFRSGSFDLGAVNEAERTVTLSLSSEEPYERSFGMEILDHSPAGCDLARMHAGAPLLWSHDRTKHLGTITSAKLENGKLIVTAKIGENADAEDRWKDIKSGVLRNASVGYELTSMKKEGKTSDGTQIFRCGWRPFEGSLLTIPADCSVGVGRADNAIDLQKEIDVEGEKGETQATRKKNMAENAPATEPAKTTIDLVAERAKWETEGLARHKQFEEYCDTIATKRGIDVRPLAKEYLTGEKRGKSFDDFCREVFVGEFKAVPVNTNGTIPGVTQKEVKRFSVLKAIRDMATNGRLDGHERDMCEAAQKEMRIDLTQKGEFVIPVEITRQGQIDRFEAMVMARAMQSASIFAEGGATVANEMQGLIEFLRNRTVLGRLGITMLGGLQGDLVFPVQTGGATAYWVSETGALTDSAATFGNKTMTPHRVGATIPLTTQILAQSSISMEAWARNELDTVVNLKVDAAGLQGSGSAGEPLGVANTVGINATVTFAGAAAWADCVEFETGIAVDNADIGTMKFALSSATVGKWKTILRDSVAGAAYLIQDNGNINGYGYERTNQITGNIAFFGVWAQLLQGRWAGRTLIVDPYALKKSGQIEVTVNEMVDFLVRQPLAFNVSTDSAAA
jgi:HK97 family phage major capsid protein/HK97 family phage prohead protease